MRPVPPPILLLLLLALCGLCAWQWHRENGLRAITREQAAEIASLKAVRDEIEARVKAADAEILRLTGSLHELKSNSVAKAEHDDAVQTNAQMRESVEKQNQLIKEQNERISTANSAILQANETIKKLGAERNGLAKRLNDVTSLYNKLANPAKAE